MKLEKMKLIKESLPLEKMTQFSLEDLQDAYLMCQAETFRRRMDELLTQLEQTKEKKQCHYLYRELENLEEMLYLVERKYSKKLKKELKKSSHH